MFYRLTHIDDRALPQLLVIDGHAYQVARSDLLLEPPGAVDDPSPDGYSVLKFFGTWPSGEEGFIASSSEPYRFRSTNQIDISRREPDRGARFSGTADQSHVRLTALDGARFIAPGTTLSFVAAPDEPIDANWRDTFDFGPPHVEIVNEALREDPEALEYVRQHIARREPERLTAARLRLERAWRVPAV